MQTTGEDSARNARKLVIVGDSMVGKTSLLFACKDRAFVPTAHVPIFDKHVVTIPVTDPPVSAQVDLALYDTAGQHDFDRLRPLSYANTNVFLICFSVDNPISALNVWQKWAPEVRHHRGECPTILVACRKDLRQEHGNLLLSELASKIGADAYFECSSVTREGVDELFAHAARLSLL